MRASHPVMKHDMGVQMTDRPAIEIDGLSKHFGEFTAVDNLTVEVESGGVVGFLGPNGAGKSTTIRMLLSLIAPTEGTARVLGHSITDPTSYMHRVGALIESPAFYPKLSGLDNLRTLAVLMGAPRSRIDHVLELVGLDERGGDKVGAYSLGMKQRLAIAAALLRDPDLIILDEPTNGLDPAGIVEVRELLIRLGREGKTIFVSSHLLAEIQAACDRLVVIKRGALVFDGPMNQLLETSRDSLVVVPDQSADTARLAAILDDAGMHFTANGAGLHAAGASDRSAEVNRLAFDHGITLRELRAEVEDLEDVFLRLTNTKETN